MNNLTNVLANIMIKGSNSKRNKYRANSGSKVHKVSKLWLIQTIPNQFTKHLYLNESSVYAPLLVGTWCTHNSTSGTLLHTVHTIKISAIVPWHKFHYIRANKSLYKLVVQFTSTFHLYFILAAFSFIIL